MPPLINKKKCSGCTLCAQICPLDVFGPAVPGQVPTVRYPDECWHCRACVIDCPKGAIEIKYPLSYMMLHRDVRKEGRD